MELSGLRSMQGSGEQMVTRKTWKEFRECGLLWWINMLLHTFGWSVVINVEDNGDITEVYPACVKFRGSMKRIIPMDILKFLNT